MRCCKIGKLQCGLNDHEFYGQIKGIKIQNISIVVPQGDSGKTQWKVLGMRGGVWRTRQEDIGEVMVNYYKSLFALTDARVSTDILDCVPTVIVER